MAQRPSERRLTTFSTTAGRSSGRSWARKTAATCRAATGIAPCTSTRSASAPPTSISTPKPRPNSRPPAKPAPSDTLNGTTQQRPTTAPSTAQRAKCAPLKNSVPLGQAAARMRTDLKTRTGVVTVSGLAGCAVSSVGRALPRHGRGHRFKSCTAHHSYVRYSKAYFPLAPFFKNPCYTSCLLFWSKIWLAKC